MLHRNEGKTILADQAGDCDGGILNVLTQSDAAPS